MVPVLFPPLDNLFVLLMPVQPAWVLPLVFSGMTIAVASVMERRTCPPAAHGTVAIGKAIPAPALALASGQTGANFVAAELHRDARIDLRGALLNALSEARRLAQPADVKLELAVPYGLTLEVQPDLLRPVLVALFRNAIQHTPGGRVFVGAMRVDAQLRIMVIDDGTHATKPFDAEARRPLARLLATSNASLVVDHRPGDGTTVVLCLPGVR
jgi:hypothetical protein